MTKLCDMLMAVKKTPGSEKAMENCKKILLEKPAIRTHQC